MVRKNICDLLQIHYPILQGGMLWIADAALASAVSNAGALGTISPYAGMRECGDPLENLQLQLHKTRLLTKQSFAVNVPLDLPESGLLINLLIEEKVNIVVTAAGSPQIYTDLLHASGAVILHVISSVSQAHFAQSCGVDAVIASGFEAGGRIGRDAIPLFSLIPQVARAVSLPVIAAGGIVDTHGMAAAVKLGAEGVQMGTRFIMAAECMAHRNYKQAIIEAGDAGTIVAGRELDPARRLKSQFALDLSAMEMSGAPVSSLHEFVGKGRARKAQIDGDLTNGDFLAGSSAGLINTVLPAADIIANFLLN